MGMRRGRNPQFMLNGEKVEALYFGSEYTAEHEWGLKDIYCSFGIADDINRIGIERRRLTEVPDNLLYLDDGKEAILWFGFSLYGAKEMQKARTVADLHKIVPRLEEQCFLRYPGLDEKNPEWKPIAAAWSWSEFCVIVEGDEYRKYLSEVYFAIKRKDVAIWTGGGHVFKRAGLLLGVIPNCTSENLKMMEEADKEALFLHLENEKIEKQFSLKDRFKAKIGYAQLTPRLSTGFETKHSIVYWFDSGRKEYGYGYMTVEQLIAFLDGDKEALRKKV